MAISRREEERDILARPSRRPDGGEDGGKKKEKRKKGKTKGKRGRVEEGVVEE